MPTTTQRTRRTVRIAQRRLALPTLRSAIGATLVVAAAAGVLSVYSASTQPPSTRFTVAARNLPAGHVLRTGDLGAVAVALPDGTSAVPADRAATLIGRRTTSAIHRADLLRRGDVAAPVDESDAGVIVPIAIDVNRSPGRGVIPGSLVTVLSTDSEGAGTVTVAERALVVSV
ncbi:MAG: SAF domain-containing protein, partial [Actinomycetes bacterium]